MVRFDALALTFCHGGCAVCCPHPNPLPRGEGMVGAGCCSGSKLLPNGQGATGSDEVHNVLPLPLGEGWGEGEQAAQPPPFC